MTSLKQVRAAIADFYDSASDAVMTIRRGIDSLSIALERLDDEIYAVEVSEKRAAKKCATKKDRKSTRLNSSH